MSGNTIAWMVDGWDETYVLALHGDMALFTKGEKLGEVWQFRGYGGQREAIDLLVRETQDIEQKYGGKVGDPVEFDLSPEAISEIYITTTFMDWVSAPRLREELLAAAERPHRTWTGPATWLATPPEDWVPVGYTEEGVGT